MHRLRQTLSKSPAEAAEAAAEGTAFVAAEGAVMLAGAAAVTGVDAADADMVAEVMDMVAAGAITAALARGLVRSWFAHNP